MGTTELWIGFHVAVLGLLLLDLGIFNRNPHTPSIREAAIWSLVWFGLSLGFGGWIFRTRGSTPGLEFLTGYFVEESLSVDNIFVFVLIFRAFRVEPRLQHRVLFWGVVGALLLRGIMIGVGAELVARFAWILYVFGAFLLYAGVHMLIRGRREAGAESSSLVRWMKRIFPIAKGQTEGRFFVFENGRAAITSLFLVLLVIESADVLFAVDSIPAVFGVTRDPFLVYTSNICAILGLRSLYFLLAGILPLFRYLEAGISSVLIFIGAKMLAEPWLHITTLASLVTVTGLLGAAALASVLAARKAGPTRA